MPQNTCRVRTGRLLEIDVAAGYERVEDLEQMTRMIQAAVAAVSEPTQLVIAADWRPCKLFTPEVAARAVDMLTRTSHRIARSGILHSSDQATSVLQVFRLVKEARQEHRRLFTDVNQMESWLSELLDEEEKQRLHTFLRARLGS